MSSVGRMAKETCFPLALFVTEPKKTGAACIIIVVFFSEMTSELVKRNYDESNLS